MVSDLLQRKAFGKKSSGAGVTQRMATAVGDVYSK
jgi:hypothetical protein